jgi:hypothetical protein
VDEAGLTLLTLLRDLPLQAVELSDAATSLVFGPGDLVRRLGGTHLRVMLAGSAAPLLQPWIAAPAQPLTEALARVRLTVVGFVAEPEKRGLLLLAASPESGRSPSGSGLNGGSVSLTGALIGMETETGASVDADSLRRAAAERARVALATGSVSDLKRQLSAILAGSLYPLLKSAGFQVNATLSYRTVGEITHFVELTYSRFSTAVELGFDFNLGACFGDFSAGRITRQRLITDGFPAIIRPIGTLWNRTGLSYALRPDSDPDLLVQRLLNDFSEHALPWLRTLDGVDALVAYFDREDAAQGRRVNALLTAVLLARAGRAADARRYLRTAEAPPETIANTAAAYGIALDELE